MADIRIAGVMRAGIFSPNHIGNDAEIFHLTAESLRKRGFIVNVYTEEQFRDAKIDEDVVMAMCREQESVEKLKELENGGKLVINSGYGIENCVRERLTRLLVGNKIPYPQSLCVATNEKIKAALVKEDMCQVWIKKGDSFALHKEDVSYCRHPEEAQEVLHEYFYRGIKRAVINRHLPGDLVKFYGVSGQKFFHWYLPFDEGHSRYAYEAINGKNSGLEFDVDKMRDICQKAYDVLNVKVYGGECIIEPGGSIKIVDFNDWPSFAPCRKKAALAIAKYIAAEIKKI